MNATIKKKSYWHETSRPYSYKPLNRTQAFDVIIVGAGITGLTTAMFLKQKGLSVAVVEAEMIGHGTSGSTTAHATAQYDHGYYALDLEYGIEIASLVQSSLSTAIDMIERITMDLKIDCDFRRVHGYFYAETKAGSEKVDRELQASKNAGLQVELVTRVPLPFKTVRGYRVKNQARFHALKYLNGLTTAIEGKGCHIFTGTRVTSVEDDHPCKVETTMGYILTAKHVVLATHTPLGFTPLQATLVPMQSFVLTAKVAQLPADALFWDTEVPYNYTRLVHSPDETLIMVGGRDLKTAHGDEAAAFAELERYVREHYAVKEIVHQWSAQFYEPAGHLPSIGKRPGSQHIYLATGFSGDGMTLGTISGHMLAKQIVGNVTAWDELYRPDRVHLIGLKPFLAESFDFAMSFVGDRFKLSDAQELQDLAPGNGRIVKADGKQIASYRDESGELHSFSAVCPHLGCIVRWNGEQKSFDCPCHGSRFDREGEVIDGPALTGLPRVEIKKWVNAKRHSTPHGGINSETTLPT